ncbi:hypothetical protein [Clavibacter michiganensis]|uniref:hypothetical protein n=1 Tax=Clavibacter michiganensis TaxID=28447 RepID=UPI00292DA5FD|nr:hypothetical protein [Clavibacter michiganensis]
MSVLALSTDLLTLAAHAAPMAVPDPGAGDMPPGFEAFTTVMGWAKWVGLGVAVVGLILLGVSMTVSARRGEGGEIGGGVGRPVVGGIIISPAFTNVGFLMGS